MRTPSGQSNLAMGSESIFREIARLAENFLPHLQQELVRKGFSHADAQDASQQAVIELLGALKRRTDLQFDSELFLKSYLRRSAIHRGQDIANRRKRERRLAPVPQVSGEADPATSLLARESWNRLSEMVARLPDASPAKSAFAVMAGKMSHDELAQSLGVSERQARRVVLSGLHQLRILLRSRDD